MKKLVIVAAVAFSASLFSCGSSDKAAEAAANDTVVAVEETIVEEAVVDTVAPADSAAAVDSVAANA